MQAAMNGYCDLAPPDWILNTDEHGCSVYRAQHAEHRVLQLPARRGPRIELFEDCEWLRDDALRRGRGVEPLPIRVHAGAKSPAPMRHMACRQSLEPSRVLSQTHRATESQLQSS